ncbi:MAG: TIGR03084 family protein [Acidobacteria bacterium]|nr:TIGR03084 family protein [Acidobacteriota bacterium]
MSDIHLTVAAVAADLIAEQEALDAVVANLPTEAWHAPTPSPGWTVADQIGHLAYFDGTATQAIVDPRGFRTAVETLIGVARDGEDAVDDLTLGAFRRMAPGHLLDVWRSRRADLADAATRLAEEARVPWYGPSMGGKSFLTARLMEAWAHGQDVIDAVDGDRQATDRLRHIAQLGVITRHWSYANRRMEAPEVEVDVVLTAPSGDTWTWGPGDAVDTVRGSAEDFCLVVTQRRHADDTGLEMIGDAARGWMVRAQAFAGPPTDGPAAGTF